MFTITAKQMHGHDTEFNIDWFDQLVIHRLFWRCGKMKERTHSRLVDYEVLTSWQRSETDKLSLIS